MTQQTKENTVSVIGILQGVMIVLISAAILGLYTNDKDAETRISNLETADAKMQTQRESDEKALADLKSDVKEVLKEVKELNQKVWTGK